MRKVRWGVLSTAKIAREQVIPAMRQCEYGEAVALASRSLEKARAIGLPRAYGSYEELIADPEIDAIYNPLPNHLHVSWTLAAARAGKHVLCEKPIACSADEARQLLGLPVKVGEAFMARVHPQWDRAKELVRSGVIGKLRLVSGFFCYFNRDPEDIVNIPGGGALLDVGCYPVTLSRMLFGEEPVRVQGAVERDPEFGTDRLTSAILDFPSGRCTFTCSTQLARYQRMQLFGEKGMIELESPFNPPPGRAARIVVNGVAEELPLANHFTIQADLFSRAILENGPVAVPVEDAVRNMEVMDRIFASA